ncbi:MAG: ABC transporter ATP-binding protein [Acidobacteria bacterium]|nr:ABC transporter ATP-binding protein [Acidobacteriota bacterium]
MIEFRSVTKSYQRSGGRQILRHALMSFFRRRQPEPFHALNNVSFHLTPGKSLAVIGPNGAGKSTLLSVVAGIVWPEQGTVTVEGSVAALLELGSGFHPDLTGAENLRLNAALLGLTRARTLELTGSIVDFSGLRDVMDEPLRTYSTGMMMRLAFSVAVNMEPDILLIDEVFAVGDQDFQAKCIERIRRFRLDGRTLICVSHDTDILLRMCDEGLWLDHGAVVRYGDVAEVVHAYRDAGSGKMSVSFP